MSGEGRVMYYPQVEGVTPTVVSTKTSEQEPVIERTEYGTDGNPYVLSMTNGKELEKVNTGYWREVDTN